MSTEQVLRNVEAAINRICIDIKQKKGGSGAGKLDSLSKLVNSYTRLLGRNKATERDPIEDGDPNYCKRLEEMSVKLKPKIR